MWANAITDPAVFREVPLRPGLMDDVENRRTLYDYGLVPAPYEMGPPPRLYLAVASLLLPLALWLLLYLLYGREPNVGYDARYEREPPGRIPPLAVPAIMRQRPDVTEMPMETLDATLATLLDAARKGVVDIVPGDARTGKGRGFVLAHPDKLEDLDELSRSVVDYYFHNVSGGQDLLTDRDIRRHSIERPDAFLFWLRQMSQEGRYWWWKHLGVGFLDPRSSRAYRFLCFSAPVLIVLAWFLMPFGFNVFSFFMTLPLVLVLFAATVVLGVVTCVYLGRTVLSWSPPAYYEHLRWQNYQRFLVEFSAIEQAPVELSAIWQEHYVYAVALGIGEKFMHGLSNLTANMDLAVELLPFMSGVPEELRIGWAGPRPGLDTRAALRDGLHQMLEGFRSGSGLKGKRVGRLQPLLFWRAGRR